MDVIATLIEVTAFNPATNTTVVGRVTDRNDPRATTAAGNAWLPLLQSAPSVGTSVFNGAFTGAGSIDLGSFTITLADGLGDAFTGLVWDGADIKIYAGVLDSGVFPLVFRAVGAGAQRKGRLELEVSLTTRESLLDANILTQSYAGTGQLEGDLGLKGTLKPWVFGAARFCRPALINAAKQIYQVSAYGPIEATTNLFEGGQEIVGFDGDKDLATIFGDAGPPKGRWWRNNEHGVFRLGSQPLYQLTCHARGDTNAVVGDSALTQLGQIIGRILALTSTISVKASSLAQLNALVNRPFDDYYDSQQSVSDALTKLMMSVGGYYTFDESGNMIFGLVRFGDPTLNLDGLNRVEPTVMGINQLPTSAPVWYLRLGAEQCHFVHDPSNLPAVIAQQGVDAAAAVAIANSKNKTFPPSSTPPVGAIDGDQWPDTSVSPQTMRRYNATLGTWVATSNQITAAVQVPYNSGQTVESLKPAQAGSDVTSTNVAAAIQGQGPIATLPSIGYGSPYLTGIGALAQFSGVKSQSPSDGRQDYASIATGVGDFITDFLYRTPYGTAAAFYGQGPIATLASIGYGSPYLTGFGGAATQQYFYLGGSFLRRADGTTNLTEQLVITAQGTAAAFLGQGLLATRSSVSFGAGGSGGITELPYGLSGFDTNGRMFAERMIYEGYGTVQYYRPQEPGANVTENRTAAALLGQGLLATLNNVVFGAQSGGVAGLPYGLTSFDVNGRMLSERMIYEGFGTVQSLRPAEFGSNVTENRTAAALLGQGALATQSSVRWRTQFSGAPGYINDPGFAPDGTEVIQVGYVYQTQTGRNLFDFFPQDINSNRTEIRSAASVYGQGALATLSSVTLNTTTIRRADGTTIVSETLIVTSLGQAASITGQGTGATANTLAQLDQDAANRLAAAQSGGQLTAPYGQTVTKTLAAGASIPIYGTVFREAGGNSGSLKAVVMGGPTGQTASQLLVSSGVPVGPSEPAGDEVGGTFTNNTGVRQSFSFYVTDVRQPTNAGGNIRQSQSYVMA